MKIYLMRHGVAREPAGAGFEADRQRPLTAEGRGMIARIARALKKLDVNPDIILSSPYVRAKETAVELAKEFNRQQHLVFSDLLIPDGKAEEIISAILDNFMVEELLIVGHLPCLSLLSSLLAAGDLDLAINIKKGGVCCLLADDLRLERRATIGWLLSPKTLLKA